jgi:16S rRNA (guanine1207-N2)-methyltransferase
MHRQAATSPDMDAAASVVIGVLDQLAAGPSPLVVDEPSGRLAQALSAGGATPQSWLRHAGGSVPAAPWPPPGPFTSAFVRLPKSKGALDLALHAAASVLPARAALVLFGRNDEGIRSAVPRLAGLASDVASIDARRHCRVLAGARRDHIPGLRPSLADWCLQSRVAIDGRERPWITYPGLFAEGGLDAGTALLLTHLPVLRPNARVLDFGCGSGLIGANVLARQPRVALDLLDADAVALVAARENLPDARCILAADLAAVGRVRYDAILSNPPLHAGAREYHGVLADLIARARHHLVPHGMLQIVVQRRVKAAELMQAAFGAVEVVAEDARFRVLRSRASGSA